MFLGIDCSGVSANLTLLLPDGCEFHAQSDTPRQADVIFPLLEKLLADADAKTSDLSAIGAITGPGSFTGIRAGLSLAQGLADGLGISAYGLDGFTALRGKTENAMIILESKRAELYVKHNNDAPQMLLPEEILRFSENGNLNIIHNLAEPNPLAVTLRTQGDTNMAAASARHAQKQYQLKVPGEILAPHYIREADAKPSAA